MYISYMAFAFVLVFAFIFSFFFRPSMFALRTLAYAYINTVSQFEVYMHIIL